VSHARESPPKQTCGQRKMEKGGKVGGGAMNAKCENNGENLGDWEAHEYGHRCTCQLHMSLGGKKLHELTKKI
jgi:hypothetical protein